MAYIPSLKQSLSLHFLPYVGSSAEIGPHYETQLFDNSHWVADKVDAIGCLTFLKSQQNLRCESSNVSTRIVQSYLIALGLLV